MPNEEMIRTFSTIFRNKDLKGVTNYDEPRYAATYYVLLIQNFPTNIQNMIKQTQKKKRGIDRDKLLKGRNILLQNGFIAEVLTQDAVLAQDAEMKLDRFDQAYLPSSPIVIWNENENLVKEFHEERARCAAKLNDEFEKKFKNHGLLAEFGNKGSITVLYSSRWFTYTILNNLNIDDNKNLDMMLSGLRSFDEKHIDSYREMLSSGRNLKIRALFDPTNYIKTDVKTKEDKRVQVEKENKKKEFEDRLSNARKLTTESEYQERKYDGTIEIKYTKVTHATSRRVIFDKMAIDARKLLPFMRDEPSYIGTIYLNDEYIKFLRENFDDSWDKSLDIKQYR